ncbi:potassium channel family protein [Aestuariivita sp.]|jgi:voltage-gated potassium channel|uniref:potassium channel family protein n=1 Tax=Aestuariivita sp. TaxID=1872407 RepID=UPI0021733171|nr:potassium channel family protein [Aestuariivita sp.]MCE8005669.1 two pore domain potassium channel family protein [Aestuariivita sp.]
MISYRIATIAFALASIIGAGTVFYRFVEGWSWLDAYFFTVVTLSTVGYGSLVPATALGKIGTTVLIFVGLGVFAVAIQQFGYYALRKREAHTEQLVGTLGKPEGVANRDAAPDEEKT